MAHFTLGTLTRYGHLLREPFGRVKWAGTETATVSHGAIDGAVRSGERVAAETGPRLPRDLAHLVLGGTRRCALRSR
jgi:monoamine oxidase